MKTTTFGLLMLATVILAAGCNKPQSAGSRGADGADGADVSGPGTEQPGAPGGSISAAPVQNGVARLSSENTLIQFVGTHVGDKPDPRTGRFTDFTGKVSLAPESQELQAIEIDIQTESLTTPIDNLTQHLKSADFFDVREHPTAKFKSTSVEKTAEGYLVTGDLTLHGVTKSISFPATASVGEQGLTLESEFVIKRSEFGMDFGMERVHDEVAMTVVVGGPPLAASTGSTRPSDGDTNTTETPATP
jgi:polyisoprenoid-binding protein YceI